jgi:hypothetical protein
MSGKMATVQAAAARQQLQASQVERHAVETQRETRSLFMLTKYVAIDRPNKEEARPTLQGSPYSVASISCTH